MPRLTNRRAAAAAGCMLLALTLMFLPGTGSMVFAAVQPVPLGVVVAPDPGGGWSLALPGGEPFYHTARPIVNPRVIAVPASTVLLILWEEQRADGSLAPCRAISRVADGLREFPVAGETDYHVMLRYAAFDAVGVGGVGGSEPALPLGLRAADVLGGCHMYIVQFWTQPLDEFRQGVTEAGGTIEEFLANHSYIVRMDAAAAVRVRALPYVRWVGWYHPAYRLDTSLLGPLFGWGGPAEPATARRYDIQVFERGLGQKQVVADRIRAMGGQVNAVDEYGFLMWATLTPAQVGALLRMDEIAFADLWGPPIEAMDIVRGLSGANYLETATSGFSGQGVRGEIQDGGIDTTHEAFARPGGVIAHGFTNPPNQQIAHGTSMYGIAFGTGRGQYNARGMLPSDDAAGIFASYRRLKIFDPVNGISREQEISELVNPALNYNAVFQSNSWSHVPVGTAYLAATSELDDILFRYDILVCQAQGNEGSPTSTQEAWAKNVVSVGGIKHRNTLDRSDDCWGCQELEWDCVDYRCDLECDFQRQCSCGDCDEVMHVCPPLPLFSFSASIGPAEDGRVKPDLANCFDEIFTTYYRPGIITPYPLSHYACGFGGTSSATAITAGQFGLFFEMWHKQLFPIGGGGLSVFADRPHATTAKAMLINTAYRYDWNAGGANADLTRMRQGWGMANLQTLYDLRQKMLIINETDLLTTIGQTATYSVYSDGTLPLRATLVYADPAGTTSSSQHRINDLNLKVTSPGSVAYSGNNGLTDGNWSVAGGAYDTKNTVENVFIEHPGAGIWTIRVWLAELNADGNPRTPAMDAAFALVVSGITMGAFAHGGDWNGDGKVDSADFYAFLQDFFQGQADFDGDRQTTSRDFVAFLGAFVAGCKQ